MDDFRPPHISAADWARMPWYARMRAERRAGFHLVPTLQETPVPSTPSVARTKVRIYRVEPGCWEITNGLTTARTATAAGAWRLLEHLARTA